MLDGRGGDCIAEVRSTPGYEGGVGEQVLVLRFRRTPFLRPEVLAEPVTRRVREMLQDNPTAERLRELRRQDREAAQAEAHALEAVAQAQRELAALKSVTEIPLNFSRLLIQADDALRDATENHKLAMREREALAEPLALLEGDATRVVNDLVSAARRLTEQEQSDALDALLEKFCSDHSALLDEATRLRAGRFYAYMPQLVQQLVSEV
jgi:hypothetical protein